MKISKKLLIVPPVLLGVGALAWMVLGKDSPEPTRLEEPARSVRLLTVEPRSIVPRAIGHGTAQPANTWRAVAEVKGRVEWVHPRLKNGGILTADTEVVRIDPTDYQLAIARLEADIRSIEAELTKLDVFRANTEASLEIARGEAVLADKELERLRSAIKGGAVAESVVDTQELAALRERGEVVTLESSLRSSEADQQVLEANLAAAQTRLDEARRDLDRATFTIPFDCRVANVDVETSEYVAVGAVLFESEDLAAAEIEAQMATGRVRHLLRPEQREAAAADLGSSEIWKHFQLEVTVRMKSNDFTAERSARFTRTGGGIDPKTRTVGFVATVENPYGQPGSPATMPVVKGMFLEVEFRGQSLPDRLVVPLSAIHEGRVYVADQANRLEIRAVELEFVQFDEAVIAEGLVSGDRVVLTDLIPAIPGMLLAPVTEER